MAKMNLPGTLGMIAGAVLLFFPNFLGLSTEISQLAGVVLLVWGFIVRPKRKRNRIGRLRGRR